MQVVNILSVLSLMYYPSAAEHNKQNCCISLVCYRKQDLVEDKIKQHSAFEYQLFNDLKPSWPKNNRLLLEFTVNGQAKCFPMAPPLLVHHSSISHVVSHPFGL